MLEDPGGFPLEQLLGVPMEIDRFLALAISITTTLAKVHQQGLVHKDINPANILVNEPTEEVRLSGFGMASRMLRERQSPTPPEVISGTLAYMAPEQTGRMNCSINSRSDVYALGVTFYRMLIGCLPFSAADPMEWVHCHIAKKPVPPSERLKNIPAPVSATVMKLLAKNAEERYQTAAGLESDLRLCLAEWRAQGRVEDFQLGEQDTPDRLVIPEKLYGRVQEVSALIAAFDRIRRGRPARAGARVGLFRNTAGRRGNMIACRRVGSRPRSPATTEAPYDGCLRNRSRSLRTDGRHRRSLRAGLGAAFDDVVKRRGPQRSGDLGSAARRTQFDAVWFGVEGPLGARDRAGDLSGPRTLGILAPTWIGDSRVSGRFDRLDRTCWVDAPSHWGISILPAMRCIFRPPDLGRAWLPRTCSL